MDAHYHIVMKAREAITETKNKLYFAYSSALDRAAFEEWQVEHSYQFFKFPKGQVAEAKNMDLVFDFASRWWGGRVAGLIEKPGSSVFGLLFEIPSKEWPIVQHKEGFITGMCIEKTIHLTVDGKTVEAIAFTTSPARASNQGTISESYIDALISGAEQSQLPATYIEKLKALPKN